VLKRIIRFSAENKYLVIAGTLVAIAIAYWTMRNIPLDALPDLSDTQVIVYSRWIAAQTSSRIRSRTRSSRRCWARPRSRPFVATPTSDSVTST